MWEGINNNEHFMIFADVDVDGCTACAIMYRYLKNYTDNVEYSINNGKKHGIENYDLSLLDGIDTMIIVDSINANEKDYQRILDKGVKIIVLDHHIVLDSLSDIEITLVSSANNYPNSELSGAGVVWKFCKYIDEITLNDYADSLVDLATCGIIADMCSVSVDNTENRYICDKGFNNQTNLAIKKINGSYEFNSQAVSFGIATLINAACRTKQNEKALRLFISDDEKEIKSLIKDLKSAKETQNEEVNELMQDIDNQYLGQEDSKILLFVIDSEADIAGLIGNKLLEKYQKPLFVLRHKVEIDEDGAVISEKYAGSARGIGVNDFKSYVDKTGLVVTGGHENAFGVEFDIEDKDEIIKRINEMFENIEFINEKDVDIQISSSQISSDLINRIKSMNRISGTGFKPVNVMINGITDYTVGTMSNGKHLKIDCGDFVAIKWNYNGDISEFDNSIMPLELSFVGVLDASFFGRKYTKQLIIDDYKIEETI